MKTLIIPDIHERDLTILTQPIADAERVVFLGDWFDTFNEHRVGPMCSAIEQYIDDPRCTLLLGNHDCHYAFNHGGFMCSGYAAHTKIVVNARISDAMWRKFKLFTHVGPYLISHAGFTEGTLQYARPEVEREAIDDALRGECGPIFGVGKVRGGWLPKGGPTWLDWNHEFIHIDGIPQIVGHTMGREVRSVGEQEEFRSYCLDTGLMHVMWVDDDGSVTVEEVPQ